MAPRHIALAVLVTIVWGLNFVVIRKGLDHYPPLLLITLRFLLAALPVFFVPRPRIPLGLMLAMGLTWFLGQFAFLFWGVANGMPPGLASLTLQSQAFFTILIATLVLHEKPSARQMAGTGVAFLGVLLIGASVGGDMTLAGLGFCLLGALSWAIGNVLVRRAPPADMFALVVWLSLVPILPALVLSLTVEGWPAISAALLAPSFEGLWTLAYLVVAATLFGFAMWGKLLKLYPAGLVAPFSLLVPLTGTVTAALVLGEQFPPLRIAGMALILAGLLVIALPRQKRGRG
ncbi:EamA family transporter [Aquabacter cavernae]|uniref:EamA family transporter n=1 Tax=Aquabacter cavernae TaxID=2496029 RepID=UPI000F8CC95B|nr:EamA family transporter [Aquabacter cavernae]